jgi:uncharacterized membrane protein
VQILTLSVGNGAISVRFYAANIGGVDWSAVVVVLLVFVLVVASSLAASVARAEEEARGGIGGGASNDSTSGGTDGYIDLTLTLLTKPLSLC